MLSIYTEEKRKAKEELQKYVRHIEFIEQMEKYGGCDNIDFNCYWGWYYHSNITATEAIKKSIINN